MGKPTLCRLFYGKLLDKGRTLRFSHLALVWLGLGCASGTGSVRDPYPVAREPSDTTPATLPEVMTPSSFTYQPGMFRYDVQQTAIVTVGGADNVPAEDTVRTTASLTYLIASSDGRLAVSALVDSLTVVSTRDTTISPRQLLVPVEVELPLRPIALESAEDSSVLRSKCDTMEEAARGLVRDTHLELPSAMSHGQSWTDSSSVVLCRGGVPLTVVSRSTFQVDPSSTTRNLISVIRLTELGVNGSGTQGVRRISISGQGKSETRFTYDLLGGHLVESTGRSVLQLSFETIQQTEQVVQQSESRAVFRNTTGPRNQ